MRLAILFTCCALFALIPALAFAEDRRPEAAATPERIVPLLESRCIACHGPDSQEGGLRLDSRAAALKGGKHGPALKPGDPKESLLLQAALHETKELAMPPKEKLSAGELNALEAWIRDGAPWPEGLAAKPVKPSFSRTKPAERIGDAWSDPRNPIVKLFGGKRLDLWSLRPVRPVEPPRVTDETWVRTPIDQFILSKLEAAKIRPSPEADRRTLARRLYFDLTGLPPTPEQLARFLDDQRPDAYEREVDELLASPRYGEHAARMWLDVVRYSDSNGFDWDEFRPKAWLFRDYVIRSLNADKPFDQFIREQLAGDELLDGPPQSAAEQDRLLATGFLRLGPQDNSAPSFNEQARARTEWMTDLVETSGAAFMGLTLSCCRCHDHKYDPLSQADHYRFRAFFEPLRYADDLPIDDATKQAANRRHNARLDAEAKPFEDARKKLQAEVRERLESARQEKLAAEEKALLELPADKLDKESAPKLQELKKRVTVSDQEIAKALTDDERGRDEKLARDLDSLHKQQRKPSFGLLATDRGESIPATHILKQGDYRAEGEAVLPGFISVLDPNPATIAPAVNKQTTGRRLALANWIASPDNPLTARVLVNRVWQTHFGQGLVATPNDFGLAGARPTHPELLDWLAREFVTNGWSLKKLHRLVVTSAVYRQSAINRDASAVAAGLYARQDLRRLTAEQLRDSMLAVSGLLNAKSDGPPVWPDLPPEVLQGNPAVLDDNAEHTKGWYPSPAAEQPARSIFLVQKRGVAVPFLETFDLPGNSTSCPRRNRSTVAPQALSLLNSPLAVAAAKKFAERVEREAGADRKAQIERAFALALGRKPAADELTACLHLLESRSLVELCRVCLNLNEFIYLD
jgi:mono/diheme cytochrome c family protein